MYNILTQCNDKIQQPNNFNVVLKDHQLTMINAMINLEKNGYIKTIERIIYGEKVILDKNISYSDVYHKNMEFLIETKFGILADDVGAGKTYTIVGLICANTDVINNNTVIQSSKYNSLTFVNRDNLIDTTLIVVPHTLMTQWKDVLSLSGLKICIIKSKIDVIKNINTFSKSDVVLCPGTLFKEYYMMTKKYRYKRIVIDEVCDIKISEDCELNASFVWFITATPKNVCYIKRNYINEYFKNMHNIVKKNITLKNDSEYIKQSMNVIDMKKILVKCFTPRELDLVKDYLNDDIIDMLNAGNIKDAINRLNCDVESSDNILIALTNKIQRDIYNKGLELQYKEQIIGSDRIKTESINVLKQEIVDLNNKLLRVKERIKEFMKTNCPICYDEFMETTPIVLPCCDNIICMRCMVYLKNKCAICRGAFSSDKVVAIANEVVNKMIKITKIDAVIDIIKNRQNGKFLLFSNYDESFEVLLKGLNSKKIVYEFVKGSDKAVNSIINKFNEGKINVLLLNAKNYGIGLNIQSATDIIIYHSMSNEMETQIIGRAQRYGRKTSLNVYYMLYENEMINKKYDYSFDLTKENGKIDYNVINC